MLLAERYDLVRRIGSGGMATVWEAQDTVLKRTVAVKLVDVEVDGDPTLGERLSREAVTTASLSHPDIVTVYDAGVAGRTAYVVMQLVAGRDLTAVLAERGPLPVAEVARVGARVAGALAAAHAGGIVHRDIKPANVLVNGDDVTVVDFGIASMSGSALAGLTAVGTLIGTAHYMAPEQAEGRPASPASDVYALGCLLTTLLTGSPPFEAENPMGVLQRHLQDEPAPLRDRRPDAPPGLEQLVAGMLAKDPAHRPTAAGVRDRLASIQAAPDAAATSVFDAPTRTAVLPMPAAGAGAGAVGAGAVGAATVAAQQPTPATRQVPGAPPPVIPPRRTGATAPPPAPTRPTRRRSRAWVLPVVLAVSVITLALIAANLDRANSPLAGTSPTAEAPVAPPEDTAPVEEAPVEPEPEPEPEPPAQPADVGALIEALEDEEVRDDLAERWAAVLDARAEDKLEKAASRTRDLQQRIDELERDGRLTPEQAESLRTAITAATADLPAPPDAKGEEDDDD